MRFTNHYRVGDLADWTNISKSGVRFLEEQGVIRSARDDTNNYRIYDKNDFSTLVIYSLLRDAGFTLEEARELIAADPHQLLEAFEEEERVLTERFERARATIAHLRPRTEAACDAGSWGICDSPGFTCFPVPKYRFNDGPPSADEWGELQEVDREYRLAMPYSWFGYVYEHKKNGWKATRCSLITNDDPRARDLPDSNASIIVPPGRFLRMVVRADLAQADSYTPMNMARDLGVPRGVYEHAGSPAVSYLLHLQRDVRGGAVYLEVFAPFGTDEH